MDGDPFQHTKERAPGGEGPAGAVPRSDLQFASARAAVPARLERSERALALQGARLERRLDGSGLPRGRQAWTFHAGGPRKGEWHSSTPNVRRPRSAGGTVYRNGELLHVLSPVYDGAERRVDAFAPPLVVPSR